MSATNNKSNSAKFKEHWADWQQITKQFKRQLNEWWTRPRQLAVIFIIIGSVGMISSAFMGDSSWSRFYEAISPEMFGIGITVLVIDAAYESRHKQQLKAQLIRELASGDNGTAIRAADELRAYGWLTDGSLQYARLKKANLQGANLQGANLRMAHLDEANLANADLTEVNLERANLVKANLTNAQLEKANFNHASLRMAQLENANLQEANLASVNATAADFNNTNLAGVNFDNALLILADFAKASFSSWTFGRKLPDEKHVKFYPLAKDTYIGFIDADLTQANLRAARNLTIEQLMQVKSLSGAILPDDTQFDEWAWGNLIYGLRVHYREFQVRWFRRRSSQKEEDGFHLTEDQKQHLIFHSMLSNFVLDENMAEGIRHHIVEEIKRDIEAKLQVLVDEEW